MSEVRIKSTSDFNASIKGLGWGDVVYLEPGLYISRQWELKPGTVIFGHGATIKQDPTNRGCGSVLSTNGELDSEVEIHGLSIDASFDTLGPMHGLTLIGSYSQVHRVRVTNYGGDWKGGSLNGLETFGIGIFTKADGAELVHCVIENCYVESAGGNYNNGIAICPIGKGGLVSGNVVVFKGATDTGHLVGLAGASGTWTGNTVIGARVAFRNEGGRNLRITNNEFHALTGIEMRGAGGNANTTIDNNTIVIDGGAAVLMDETYGFPVTATTISNNAIIGTGRGIILSTAKNKGQHVLNNKLAPEITDNAIAPDAVCSGNRTLNGALIASLPDRPEPQSPFTLPAEPPKQWKEKIKKWALNA